MGDLVALNRRAKLPTMIIQNRPHGQAKQLQWGTIKAQDPAKQPQEVQITRTVKKYAKPPGKMRNKTDAQKQRRRNHDVELRRKVQMGRMKRTVEEEEETETPIREHLIPDDAWQIVGATTIIAATRLQTAQR